MDIQKKKKKYSLTQKDIDKRYGEIPGKIGSLLMDPEIGKKIKNILATNKIPKEKFPKALSLVSLVLIGLYHRDDFIKYLTKDLGTDSLSTQNAALEINRSIFLPYKEIIDELYAIPLEDKPAFAKAMAGKKVKFKPSLDKARDKKIFPKTLNDKIGFPSPNKVVEDVKKNKPRFIFGKEMKVKPTLESASPLTSVFNEVKAKEKRVLSTLEVGGKKKTLKSKTGFFKKFKDAVSFKPKESQPKADPPLVKKSLFKPILSQKSTEKKAKFKLGELGKKILPTKIVNFSDSKNKPVGPPHSSKISGSGVVVDKKAVEDKPTSADKKNSEPFDSAQGKKNDNNINLKKIKF